MSNRVLKLCLRAYPRARRRRDGELLVDLAMELAADHGAWREALGLVAGGVRARWKDRGSRPLGRGNGLHHAVGRIVVNLVLYFAVLFLAIVALTVVDDVTGGPPWDRAAEARPVAFATLFVTYFTLPALLFALLAIELGVRRAESLTQPRAAMRACFALVGLLFGLWLGSFEGPPLAPGAIMALAGFAYGSLLRLPVSRAEAALLAGAASAGGIGTGATAQPSERLLRRRTAITLAAVAMVALPAFWFAGKVWTVGPFVCTAWTPDAAKMQGEHGRDARRDEAIRVHRCGGVDGMNGSGVLATLGPPAHRGERQGRETWLYPGSRDGELIGPDDEVGLAVVFGPDGRVLRTELR